jgi:hypothetical protein
VQIEAAPVSAAVGKALTVTVAEEAGLPTQPVTASVTEVTL